MSLNDSHDAREQPLEWGQFILNQNWTRHFEESVNVPFFSNSYISSTAQREKICIFTDFPEVPWSAQPLGGFSISQTAGFSLRILIPRKCA